LLGGGIRLFAWFWRIKNVSSVVLIFYVATQLYGSATQLAGQGEVDYLAHVGGGLTGLVFWYTTGKTPKEQNEKDSWV
jgi:membrane associated rhomboid family serine protease